MIFDWTESSKLRQVKQQEYRMERKLSSLTEVMRIWLVHNKRAPEWMISDQQHFF